ncbi:MAG: type II CAAX prenyl endopeptidase Rce1 family protein [Anaerolineales bacterium]|jgi:membrane protease YdiL (CAAX protease family)
MIKKYPLICFFALSYALSWIIEIPLALQTQGIIPHIFPFWLHYLTGYGPLLSAIIVTGITGGSKGLSELWGRMSRWRVKPGWWLVAVSPLGIYLLAGAALWVLQGQKMYLAAMGQVDYLPPLGLAAIPLWILTFGIGEETGWRGFALPRLQERHDALSATFLLWIFWALWHLPLFFYSYDPIIIPGMLIGLLAGAITFTWLYNSTGGSVLLTAIWHGLFNYTTACTSCKTGLIAAVISTVVMVWAVVIVIWFQPAELVHTRKLNVFSGRNYS